MKEIILVEFVESKIYLIRGHRVMLDSDLAELYEVETRTLVQAVKRNINRFPPDFMFQLNFQDVAALRSQTVTLKKGRGQHRKYASYVFTENGVAMLSSVLNSERAVQVNIAIMRVFVKLREMIASNKDLAKRLDDLEKKYDAQFRVVFDAIRELMRPPEKPKRKIGFKREAEKG
jgi:phage regulator Rha-like protein